MQTTLEHMSIWGLISEASLVVQAVMMILVLASVSSWYLIIRRSVALRLLPAVGFGRSPSPPLPAWTTADAAIASTEY